MISLVQEARAQQQQQPPISIPAAHPTHTHTHPITWPTIFPPNVFNLVCTQFSSNNCVLKCDLSLSHLFHLFIHSANTIVCLLSNIMHQKRDKIQKLFISLKYPQNSTMILALPSENLLHKPLQKVKFIITIPGQES